MRLIDADALTKEVNDNKELSEAERVYIEGILLNAPTIIKCGITSDGLPLMDLTPRPHGEWIYDSDNIPICNQCEEIALQRIFVKVPGLIQDVKMVHSNFCPHCEAQMTGGAT